jgi:parallel beta-helix repeat protein
MINNILMGIRMLNKILWTVCLVVVLFISQMSFLSAFAQPSLEPTDGIRWAIKSEPRYLTYYCEIPNSKTSPIHVDIKNVTDSIFFSWRQEANHPGLFGNIKFKINETEIKTLRDNNSTFEDIGPYHLTSTDRPAFDIYFKKGGKIWIRFPVSTNLINRTPSIRSLSSDKNSPQGSNVLVGWSVDAFDQDNDKIFYKYFLNGIQKSDWTEGNKWYWNTSEGINGSNKIEVWIRDGKNANESYYDDKTQREFLVAKFSPEQSEPENEKVAVFNVSTCNEFIDALNNSTNCKKVISLRYMRCIGSYLIKNNKNKLIIKSHPDNRLKPILDGNGGDYVIAIEDSSNVSIDGLDIKNAKVDIYMEDVADSSITNCKVENFIVDGISLNNTTGTRLQDNKIESSTPGNHKTGINLTECKDNCEILDNDISLPNGDSRTASYDILLINSSGNELFINPSEEGYLIQQDSSVSWKVNCTGSYPCCTTFPTDDCDCNDYDLQGINNWFVNCRDDG